MLFFNAFLKLNYCSGAKCPRLVGVLFKHVTVKVEVAFVNVHKGMPCHHVSMMLIVKSKELYSFCMNFLQYS